MKAAFFRLALVIVLATAGARAAEPTEKFDYAILTARARELATKPYVPAKGEVPEWLRALNYDQLRQIEFGGANSLWRSEKLPFQVQYLHPGSLLDKMVHLFELRGSEAVPIPFRREYFNYGVHYRTMKPGDLPDTLGFAGFRLMFAFDGSTLSEFGSFAGASYFRFLSGGAAYGLSARGLALNTWEPEGEEFPIFTQFWLERPVARAKSMNVYALLESESVTGAYRFTVTPGADTVVQVKATLFVRKNTKAFGVAPLTSMFWHGENSDIVRDFRPEVHDSDGLLVHNGVGEWLWRPLVNPKDVRVSSLLDENPRAFGLLQRDRDFESYQDLEAAYHRRPSAIVEPIGKWGRGAVRLIEVPTTNEFNDNVVALWVPAKAPAAGEPIDIEYKLHWTLDPSGPPTGFVRATRLDRSAGPESERFVIDFDGAKLRTLAASTKVEQVISVGDGAKLNQTTLQKNEVNGTWRVVFTIHPDGSGRPVELRCFLRDKSASLSETWSYLWQP
jgi:glucans biosynthesis protein